MLSCQGKGEAKTLKFREELVLDSFPATDAQNFLPKMDNMSVLFRWLMKEKAEPYPDQKSGGLLIKAVLLLLRHMHAKV